MSNCIKNIAVINGLIIDVNHLPALVPYNDRTSGYFTEASNVYCLGNEDLEMFDTCSVREAEEFAGLLIGISGTTVPRNIMLSQDAKKGISMVNLAEKILKLNLISCTYNPRSCVKIYEGKIKGFDLFIIVSDRSVPTLKKKFPREYNHIIVFDKLSQVTEGEDK